MSPEEVSRRAFLLRTGATMAGVTALAYAQGIVLPSSAAAEPSENEASTKSNLSPKRTAPPCAFPIGTFATD
jgi:hypothetical protein